MKFAVTFLMFTLAVLAEDLKLTEKERLAIRDPQVKVLSLQTQMSQMQTQFETLKKELDIQSKNLSTAVTKAMESHKCKDCGFNAELTELTRPAPKVVAKK